MERKKQALKFTITNLHLSLELLAAEGGSYDAMKCSGDLESYVNIRNHCGVGE